MASKRQPSKQKRAAQNRNQRAALAARAARAQAGPATPSTAPGSAGSGSLLSRLRGGGSSASAAKSGAGRRPSLKEARALQPPGFRAALSAVLAAVAALLLCTFALRYPVDASGDLYTSEKVVADWSATALRAAGEQPDATAAQVVDSIDDWNPGRSKDTVIKALWPFSLAILLPLAGAGLAFWAVRRRSSSKIVNRALYATLFGAVLTQGLLLLFLPVVLGVGVAMFQVRKAEAVAAARAAATADAGGDVIDVESVEGDLDEAEAETETDAIDIDDVGEDDARP
jgi:hypothetical protein